MKTHRLVICFCLLSGALWAAPITVVVDTTEFFDTGTVDAGDLDDYDGQYVNMLEDTGDFVDWTHTFVLVPGVLSATLTLYLRDDEVSDGDERGYVESGGASALNFDASTPYTLNLIPSSVADGSCPVRLLSTWEDFFIDKSEVSVTYEPEVQPIPEASTLLLFGSGLPGLALWARCRRRKIRA